MCERRPPTSPNYLGAELLKQGLNDRVLVAELLETLERINIPHGFPIGGRIDHKTKRRRFLVEEVAQRRGELPGLAFEESAGESVRHGDLNAPAYDTFGLRLLQKRAHVDAVGLDRLHEVGPERFDAP